MNGATRMGKIIYHFGVFLVVGVLQTGNCQEVDSIYVLKEATMTWPEAQEECAKLGRILVKINSQQEMDDLLKMDNEFSKIISGGEFWTGLYTTTQLCNDYKWDGGFPATWFVWDQVGGEPDDCDNSRCIRLRHGLMRTITCSSSYPFICQTLQEETTTTATTTSSTTTTTTTTTSTTTTTPTTTTTTTSTTTTPLGTTGDSLPQEETTSSSTNTSPTEAEITTIPLTDDTLSEVTSTIATTTERITTIADDSPLREDTTTTTTPSNSPTNGEITTITSTEGPSTRTEITSATSTPHGTTTSTDNPMLEKTTTRMVGETTVSNSEMLGNITCLCNINVQNNTTQLHGIIPSSTTHQSSLLMSGYAPACSESFVWDTGFLSREEKLALLSALKKHLNVAKNTTSLYKRSRTSVYDNRVSATSVGALGVCILVGVFGTFIAADASRFYTYCRKL